MALYQPDAKGDPTAASNETFMLRFAEALGAAASGMRTASGTWSRDMVNRVKAAVFYKAYADKRLIAAVAEDAGPDRRNVLAALQQAAPMFARARAIDPEFGGIELADAITGGVEIVTEASDKGLKVEEFVRQGDLLGDTAVADPNAVAVAKFIAEHVRSASKMGEAFKAMGGFLEQRLKDRQTQGMFDDGKPLTIPALIEDATGVLVDEAAPVATPSALPLEDIPQRPSPESATVAPVPPPSDGLFGDQPRDQKTTEPAEKPPPVQPEAAPEEEPGPGPQAPAAQPEAPAEPRPVEIDRLTTWEDIDARTERDLDAAGKPGSEPGRPAGTDGVRPEAEGSVGPSVPAPGQGGGAAGGTRPRPGAAGTGGAAAGGGRGPAARPPRQPAGGQRPGDTGRPDAGTAGDERPGGRDRPQPDVEGEPAGTGPVQPDTGPEAGGLAGVRKNYGKKNKVVTLDEKAEIERQLKELAGTLTAGVDPNTMVLLTRLAMFHIEAGARSFPEFSRAMAENLNRIAKGLGDRLRKYFRSLYESARYSPDNQYADEMSTPEEIERYEAEVTRLEKPIPKDAQGIYDEMKSTRDELGVLVKKIMDAGKDARDTLNEQEAARYEWLRERRPKLARALQDMTADALENAGLKVNATDWNRARQMWHAIEADAYGAVQEPYRSIQLALVEAFGPEMAMRALRQDWMGLVEGRERFADTDVSGSKPIPDNVTELKPKKPKGGTKPRKRETKPAPAETPEPEAAPAASRTSGEVETRTKYRGLAGTKEGVMTPTFMAEPQLEAQKALTKRVGDLREFVAGELGYKDAAAVEAVLYPYQIDAVALAIDRVKSGGKSINADETGMGKGRVAAAMLRWAKRNDYVPVFLTQNNVLLDAMARDLSGIKEPFTPFIFNASHVLRRGEGGEKVLTALGGNKRTRALNAIARDRRLPYGYDMLFATYSQFRDSENPQRRAVDALAGRALFVLDEAHEAAGPLHRSEDGEFVETTAGFFFRVSENRPTLTLSATFAKRPDNMPLYFDGTSLSGAVLSFHELIESMQEGGEVMQAWVSSRLAGAGELLRRERGVEGIEYREHVTADIGPHQRKLADGATQGMRSIMDADRVFERNVQAIAKAMGIKMRTEVIAGRRMRTSVSQPSSFASTAHNLVSQLVLGLKVDAVVERVMAAHKKGEKPMIALQNTMETYLKRAVKEGQAVIGEEFKDADLRTALRKALARTRALRIKHPGSNRSTRIEVPLDVLPEHVRSWYNRADRIIEKLGIAELPLSPIDRIMSELRKRGLNVGEITGRSLTVDYEDGNRLVRRKKPHKGKVIADFNGGEIDVLVLNASGSTGISLHAAEEFKDRRRRVMFIVQPALDVNTFTQTMGRINRVGQVVKPRYEMLVADIPAEKRIAAILRQKLASLNANTTANTESDVTIETADILNKYGDGVAHMYLYENPRLAGQLSMRKGGPVDPSRTKPDAPFAEKGTARKFTGRLALLPVEQQIETLAELESEYANLIAYLTATGRNDLVITGEDIQAEIIESMILQRSEVENNPLAADVTMHVVGAKIGADTPTPNEVRASIDEGLEGRNPQTAADNLIEKRQADDSYYQYLLEEETADERKLADAIASGDKAQERKARAALNQIRDALKYYKERRTETENRIRQLTIGTRLFLDTGVAKYAGVVTHVFDRHNPKSNRSPWSPSSIVFRIAINDQTRAMDMNMNDLDFARVLLANEAQADTDLPADAWIDKYFRQRPEDSRVARSVVTGNLLQALALVSTASETDTLAYRLVEFTDSAGTTHEGLLGPPQAAYQEGALADLAKLGVDLLRSEASTALEYLRGPGAPNGQTRRIFADRGGVVIEPGDGNNLQLSIFNRTEEGDEYLRFKELGTSQSLARLMNGRNLVRRYGNMEDRRVRWIGQFPADKLTDVWRRLYVSMKLPSEHKAAFEAAGGTVPEAQASFDGGNTMSKRRTEPLNDPVGDDVRAAMREPDSDGARTRRPVSQTPTPAEASEAQQPKARFATVDGVGVRMVEVPGDPKVGDIVDVAGQRVKLTHIDRNSRSGDFVRAHFTTDLTRPAPTAEPVTTGIFRKLGRRRERGRWVNDWGVELEDPVKRGDFASINTRGGKNKVVRIVEVLGAREDKFLARFDEDFSKPMPEVPKFQGQHRLIEGEAVFVVEGTEAPKVGDLVIETKLSDGNNRWRVESVRGPVPGGIAIAVGPPRRSAGAGRGVRLERLQPHLQPTIDRLKGIEVEFAAAPAEGMPANTVAYTDGSKAVLVYNNIDSLEAAEVALAHEVVGHLGMDRILGNDYRGLLSGFRRLKQSKNAAARSVLKEVRERYGEQLNETEELHEFVALLAERRQRTGTLGRFLLKAVGAVRAALRKLGFKLKFSVLDIHSLLQRSARATGWERGKYTDGLYAIGFDVAQAEPPPLTWGAERPRGATVIDLDKTVAQQTEGVQALLRAAVRDAGADLAGLGSLNARQALLRMGREIGRRRGKGFDPYALAVAELHKRGVWGLVDTGTAAQIGGPGYDAPEPMPFRASRRGPEKVTAEMWADNNDRKYLRFLERTGKPFRKRLRTIARRWLSRPGLLPERVFMAKEQRDQAITAAEFNEIAQTLAWAERDILRAYKAKSRQKLAPAQLEQINAALEGRPDALQAIPESVRGHVDHMRKVLDGLSDSIIALHTRQFVRMVENGASQEQLDAKRILIETIMKNRGSYLHRAYAAHYDPKWPDKVSKETKAEAAEFLAQRIMETSNRITQISTARAWGLRMVEKLLYEGTAADVGAGRVNVIEHILGDRDMGIMMQRRDIAEPIRRLLGEYKDPIINYARSATKMTAFVANSTFIDKVYHMGRGRYLWRAADKPFNLRGRRIVKLPNRASYGALAGLYTYKEIHDGLVDAVEHQTPTAMVRAWQTMNIATKAGKTVGSPVTQARNFLSNILILINNGNWRAFTKGGAFKIASSHFRDLGNMDSRVFLRKMKLLGVAGDAAHAREIQQMFRESGIGEFVQSWFDARGWNRTHKIATAPFKYAQRMYAFSDDIGKVMSWMAEVDRLKKAMPGKSLEFIEREAAQRVRDTTPTYSTAPKIIQALTRWPVLGPFVRFPYAATRAMVWEPLKYIKQDWNTPGMRGMAMSRAAGMVVAGGMLAALSAVTKDLIGMDDEEEEAFRNALPPWSKNSRFVYLGRHEDGRVAAWDSTYHNPNALVHRALVAALRGRPLGETLLDTGREVVAPFVSPEIVTGAALEAVRNRTLTGRRVYNPAESPDKVAGDVAAHMWRSMRPGILFNLEETYLAARGRRRFNEQPYDMRTAAAAWAGFRVTNLDLKSAVLFQGYAFAERKREAMSPLNQAMRAPSTSPRGAEASVRSAFRDTTNVWTEAYMDLGQMVAGALSLGASRTDVVRALQGAGLARADIGHVLRYRVRPIEITDERGRSLLSRDAFLGKDAAGRAITRQRIGLSRRLSAEWNRQLSSRWRLNDGDL